MSERADDTSAPEGAQQPSKSLTAMKMEFVKATVAFGPALPPRAPALAVLLVDYSYGRPECTPSLATMARDLQVNKKTVAATLEAMVDVGLVSTRKGTKNSSKGQTIRWHIPPGAPALRHKHRSNGLDQSDEGSVQSTGPVDELEPGSSVQFSAHDRSNRLDRNTCSEDPREGEGVTPPPPNPHPGTSRCGDAGTGDAPEARPSRPGFQSLMEAYPPPSSGRWGKPAREEARRAFDAALADGVDPVAIIEGATHYAATVEPRYLSKPAKWIARRGWEAKRGRAPSRQAEPEPDIDELPPMPVLSEGMRPHIEKIVRKDLEELIASEPVLSERKKRQERLRIQAVIDEEISNAA